MWYLKRYVGPLSAVLNYPFFFWMRSLFLHKGDMYNIRNFYNEWSKNLGDISKLGLFIDNNYNARFLSNEVNFNTKGNSAYKRLLLK